MPDRNEHAGSQGDSQLTKRDRIIEAVYDRPWAITREKLTDIVDFLDKRAQGLSIDVSAFDNGTEKGAYQVKDGVAVIPVFGVMSQKMNLMQRISGGVSTEILRRDIQDAIRRSDVKAIILDMDTPGGAVEDIPVLSDFIYAVRGQKPIVAVANSSMASAGYWIGSAADRVIMASATAISGSIGVVAVHRDISKYEEKQGIKTTEITAGTYKRIVSQYRPLSEEGEEVLQRHADYIYSLFVEAVARNRGISIDEVLSNMADGKLFIGQQAVDAGLADDVESFDSVFTRLAEGKKVFSFGKGVQAMSEKENKEAVSQDEKILTLETVREENPGIYQEIFDAGILEGRQGAFQDAYDQGAEDERNRIQGIEDVTVMGFEDLVAKVKFDGKTTAEQVATEILKLQKARNAPSLLDIQGDSPVVPFSPDGYASEVNDRAEGAKLIAKASPLS